MKMALFPIASLIALIFYLVLSAGSGSIFYWSIEELLMGTVFSLLVGLVAKRVFSKLGVEWTVKALNPLRWINFIVYFIGPLFFAMAKANLDVAYRVITGKIKPGIVKIDPKLKSNIPITILANSITLTPGTLTVEVNEKNELFVHWINVKNKHPTTKQVCGSFAEWAGRIAE